MAGIKGENLASFHLGVVSKTNKKKKKQLADVEKVTESRGLAAAGVVGEMEVGREKKQGQEGVRVCACVCKHQ